MSETPFVLLVAPIVEAVVDIDCDMPPGLNIESLDAAGKVAFGTHYPQSRRRLFSEAEVLMELGQPTAVKSREALQALLYASADERQLIQMRPNGFSFNRLAPYSTLSDYLPEIERTWRLFSGLARPLVCRTIRMRYINRIEIPLIGGEVDLDKYFKVAPRVADVRRFDLAGFFDQQTLIEKATGSQATVVLATHPSSGERLHVIFDITAIKPGDIDPGDWPAILGTIDQLRELKNTVFRNSLTPEGPISRSATSQSACAGSAACLKHRGVAVLWTRQETRRLDHNALNWLSDGRNRASGSSSATCSGSPEASTFCRFSSGRNGIPQPPGNNLAVEARNGVAAVSAIEPCKAQPVAAAGEANRQHPVTRRQPVQAHGSVRVHAGFRHLAVVGQCAHEINRQFDRRTADWRGLAAIPTDLGVRIRQSSNGRDRDHPPTEQRR